MSVVWSDKISKLISWSSDQVFFYLGREVAIDLSRWLPVKFIQASPTKSFITLSLPIRISFLTFTFELLPFCPRRVSSSLCCCCWIVLVISIWSPVAGFLFLLSTLYTARYYYHRVAAAAAAAVRRTNILARRNTVDLVNAPNFLWHFPPRRFVGICINFRFWL